MINKLHAYLQLSLADFRERTRRSSFVVTMLAILFFGYLVITGKYGVQFGEYRTFYDAHWAGTLMAMSSAIMLALFGFYLIKGSIKRDRVTEVGQIIAATPMTKRAYIISKLVSNTMVLWFMVAVLAVMGFLTLLYRNETGSINLWAYVLPFLLIALPAMIFVGAMAVLFDASRWLRGSVGNVVYLFVAEMCIVLAMFENQYMDLGAAVLFTESVRVAAEAAFPGESIPLIMGFVMFDPQMQVEVFKTFVWNGIEWTGTVIQIRLFWIAAGLVVAAIAIPFFDRFDPAKARIKTKSKKKRIKKEVADTEVSIKHSVLSYTELVKPSIEYSLPRMIAAELRVALKGYHWFWYLVAVGLMAAQLAAPFEIARQYLTPMAMVWPLVIWSSMGTREAQSGTHNLLFSSPEPVRRQFPAIWLSGLLVALISIGAMLIRSLVSGHLSYTLALLIGALFVPTAALVFGTLSKSKRLFEVSYLMFWYVGSIEHLAAIDMLGTTDEAITAGKLVILILMTGSFALTAFAVRWQQIRHS
ncbi:MAG: hypothetical protein JSV52_14365 [Candidatus Zixiibacteriota bacterium]|nr:MAG: hypothetical protein JSV52_14365 [candidate division Zixibacteria bacterium]